MQPSKKSHGEYPPQNIHASARKKDYIRDTTKVPDPERVSGERKTNQDTKRDHTVHVSDDEART